MDADDWKEISAELDKPLDGKTVKTRNQAGRPVSYIESWHAIAEANRIFGFNGWTSETLDLKCVAERERKIGNAGKDGWGVSYTAKVRVTVDGIVREGVGAGHGIDADLGQAHESAIKEAESDARKRSLITFGNPFGLALYDKTQASVDRDDGGQKPPPANRNEPAPTKAAAPAGRPGAKFEALKEALDTVGHEAALKVWIADVKAAVEGAQVSLSERAMLQTLLENKRGFLAQRSAAA